MPAGVSLPTYMKFFVSAMLTMFAGAQVVHMYYKPLADLDNYIEEEMKLVKKK